jgi:hypothetical protein
LFFQGQVSYQPPQSSVLALQILHILGLIDLQAAVILTPAVITLLGNIRFLACDGDALSLGRLHLDLAQHQHDLLRTWLLSSLHPQLLWSKLILSISPVQSQPVRSPVG